MQTTRGRAEGCTQGLNWNELRYLVSRKKAGVAGVQQAKGVPS